MFFTFVFLGHFSAVLANPIIDQFLNEIGKNSLHIKQISSETQADRIMNQSELFVFESVGFLNGNYANQKTAPTSPFVSRDSNSLTYGVGWNKLWSQGFSSELSYSLTDNETNFDGRPSFSFLSPRLALTLKSDLLRDLIFGQYRFLKQQNLVNSEVISLQDKVDKKNVLIQSLFDYSNIIANNEELLLQRELCRKTRVQANKLSQKRKRGSVSKKDYLLSLRELSVCQATIDELEKRNLELKQSFEATYSTKFDSFESLKTSVFFKGLQAKYEKLSAQGQNTKSFDIKNKDEVQAIETQLRALNLRQKQLDAKSKSNLALEVSAGAVGAADAYSDAHEDISDLQYPFVSVGLRIDLPLKDRQALAEKNANNYRRQALAYQKDRVISSNQIRFDTLKQTLKKDFEIFKKYENSVNLSQRVLREAVKDFNNGRLDFYNLTEFNKRVIQDQKTLTAHRNQLVVRVVEYLDYFQFFDRFGLGEK